MICSTLVNALSLLLIGVHHVRASKITMPPSVKADTEFTVRVDNEGFDKWGGSDRWSKFNVYLTLQLPDSRKSEREVCVLANSTDLGSLSETKNVKVKIPADAAPDGTKVMAGVLIYESDPYGNLTSGTHNSGTATFEGGKAKWAEFETSGIALFLPERIPCTSYACARECGAKHWTVDYIKNITSYDDYKPVYECMSSCSGTTFDPWSVWVAKYQTVNDTDSASTTSAASASATASTTTSVSQTGSSASASASSTSADTGAAGQLLAGNFGSVVAVMLAGLAMF